MRASVCTKKKTKMCASVCVCVCVCVIQREIERERDSSGYKNALTLYEINIALAQIWGVIKNISRLNLHFLKQRNKI